MKAVVAAFNQEKALVGAFSVLTNLRMELFQALVSHGDGLHVSAAAAAAAPVLAVLAALALDGDQPRPARVPAPRPAPAPGAVRQQRDGDAVSAAGAVHQSEVRTEVT